MKSILKLSAIIFMLFIVLSVASCSPVDKNYGVSSEQDTAGDVTIQKVESQFPVIRSTDTVMPKFVDISRYDEENYSDIYLGRRFNFKVTYAGTKFTVPTTYKAITKNGWALAENSWYGEDSIILPNSTAKVECVNDEGIKITTLFHNPSKSSQSLKKCDIVKFIIESNALFDSSSEYGIFNVNGVTNHSAITDVIEALGAPSHFYAISQSEYYLDYFIDKNDRRNGITVYIDPQEDIVTKVEFTKYG